MQVKVGVETKDGVQKGCKVEIVIYKLSTQVGVKFFSLLNA